MAQVVLKLLLLMVLSLSTDAAPTTRTVVPDITGMIYPSSSSGQRVQFGDPAASFSTAYDFAAPPAQSVPCDVAQVCLELKMSSVFQMDPFFLYQYDANTPLASATFDSYDSRDIMPIISGEVEAQPTTWWFQSNVSTAEAGVGLPALDLLLHFRQRSQLRSARDQLLMRLRVELKDSRTATIPIETYSVYGNQLVRYTTHRIGPNVVQVRVSFTKNRSNQDVNPYDSYPWVESRTPISTTPSSSAKGSCDACYDVLDACRDVEPCRTIVIPCLISHFEELTQHDASSYVLVDESGTKQVDILQPLATCVANLPITLWSTIREVILCLAREKCSLGDAGGEPAGEQYSTILRLTDGTQKFVVAPVTAGTDNVELGIVTRDSLLSDATRQTFEYSASASRLGIFLRSFVLLQAAKVSVLAAPSSSDTNELEVSLMYSDALMLSSVDFYTTAGKINMTEDLPARAAIEYSASSSQPTLDKILGELRARISPTSDVSNFNHSWILAKDCLSCSSQLFECSSSAIVNHSCNFLSTASSFAQCLQKQLPFALFEGLMNGIANTRPVGSEILRCLSAHWPSNTSKPQYEWIKASSSLSCFAETRCPFGQISLVHDAAIVLETASYVQLLRVSRSPLNPLSIWIEYKVGRLFIAATAPIDMTSTEQEIESVIMKALESTGIAVSASLSRGNDKTSEWTLEVIYRYVFTPGLFTMNAVANDTSVGSTAIKQAVMEGGAAQLRLVPRDKSKIFNHSEIEHSSSTGSSDSDATTSSTSNSVSEDSSQGSASLFSSSSASVSTSSVDSDADSQSSSNSADLDSGSGSTFTTSSTSSSSPNDFSLSNDSGEASASASTSYTDSDTDSSSLSSSRDQTSASDSTYTASNSISDDSSQATNSSVAPSSDSDSLSSSVDTKSDSDSASDAAFISSSASNSAPDSASGSTIESRTDSSPGSGNGPDSASSTATTSTSDDSGRDSSSQAISSSRSASASSDDSGVGSLPFSRPESGDHSDSTSDTASTLSSSSGDSSQPSSSSTNSSPQSTFTSSDFASFSSSDEASDSGSATSSSSTSNSDSSRASGSAANVSGSDKSALSSSSKPDQGSTASSSGSGQVRATSDSSSSPSSASADSVPSAEDSASLAASASSSRRSSASQDDLLLDDSASSADASDTGPLGSGAPTESPAPAPGPIAGSSGSDVPTSADGSDLEDDWYAWGDESEGESESDSNGGSETHGQAY